MKKKILLLIPSLLALFSCVVYNARESSNAISATSYSNNNEVNNKITIKFDANGGTLTGLSSFKVDSGSKFASFKDKQPIVTRISSSGEVTNPGWYIKNGSSKEVVDDNTTFASDVTLFANWATYNVTFNSGLGKWSDTEAGANKTISDTMYVHSDDIAKPTYVGGSFIGWYDGDNKISFPYSPTSDVTLTAKYDVKQVSLFFYADQGYFNDSTTTKTVTFKVPYDTTWENVKKNASFPKVDVESDDLSFDQYVINDAAIDDSYKFTSSKVIKANFVAAYTLTFDVATNGGQWVETSTTESKKVKIKCSESHTFGDYKTVGAIPNSKSATGSYDELGWFSDTAADTDALKDSDTITSSKIIYAYYKVPHTITFNGSYFTVSESITSFVKKDQIQYTIVPTYSYAISKSEIVVKWNGETKEEGEDKDYTYTVDAATGNGTLLIKNAPGYDITVNLTPTEVWHNITIYYNDDASTVKSLDPVRHGTIISEPSMPGDIEKEGYTFVRWYSDENLNIKSDFTQKVETDITLYAQWKPAEISEDDDFYFHVEEVEIDGTTYNCLTEIGYYGSEESITKFSLPSEYYGEPITAIGVSDEYSYFEWPDVLKNATEVYLPDSYKLISYGGYDNGVFRPENLPNLEKLNIDNIEVFAPSCFSGCSFIKEINLPNCKKYLSSDGDPYTFSNCPNITKITNIGQCTDFPSLFDGCENITSITIPKTITGTIKATQFSSSAGITNLYVEPGNTAYTSRDNKNKECNIVVTNDSDKKVILGITNSIIPDGCTEITDGSFASCKKTKIDIPSSVKKIGSMAFKDCRLLEEVNFSDDSNCTEIGSSAFSNCDKLKKITFPKNCDTVGSNAFSGCSSLEEIVWNDKITALSNSAFSQCKSLKSVTIPETITSIGSSCFYGCTSLESVTIPETITSISSSCFSNCTSLANVNIPNTVTSIGAYAFSNTAVSSVNIPASVTSLDPEAFYLCKNLSNITIDSNNTKYSNKYNGTDVNGVVEGDKFFWGTENSVIPEGITSIGTYAFNARCSTMPTLPSTCTTIGNQAFYQCKFSEVTLDYVTDLNWGAFYYCSNLTTVKLKNIKNIGTNGEFSSAAFGYCYKLTSIYLPKTIEFIGYTSFYNGGGSDGGGAYPLDIYYEGTEDEWNTAAANFNKNWNYGRKGYITMHYESWNP